MGTKKQKPKEKERNRRTEKGKRGGSHRSQWGFPQNGTKMKRNKSKKWWREQGVKARFVFIIEIYKGGGGATTTTSSTSFFIMIGWTSWSLHPSWFVCRLVGLLWGRTDHAPPRKDTITRAQKEKKNGGGTKRIEQTKVSKRRFFFLKKKNDDIYAHHLADFGLVGGLFVCFCVCVCVCVCVLALYRTLKSIGGRLLPWTWSNCFHWINARGRVWHVRTKRPRQRDTRGFHQFSECKRQQKMGTKKEKKKRKTATLTSKKKKNDEDTVGIRVSGLVGWLVGCAARDDWFLVGWLVFLFSFLRILRLVASGWCDTTRRHTTQGPKRRNKQSTTNEEKERKKQNKYQHGNGNGTQ